MSTLGIGEQANSYVTDYIIVPLHPKSKVGHVREPMTKTGNPYFTGMIGGQQVFLFLRFFAYPVSGE